MRQWLRLVLTAAAAVAVRAQLAPLDPQGAPVPGSVSVELALRVVSPALGFADVVAQGAKLLLSTESGVPFESFALRDASVIDEAAGVYGALYESHVVEDEAVAFADAMRVFVDSGGLDSAFADMGLTGIEVRMDGDAPGADPVDTADAVGNAADGVPPEPQGGSATSVPDAGPVPSGGNFIVEQLPELAPGSNMHISLPLALEVLSPVIKFPKELRRAIKWFIANHTDTLSDSGEGDEWYVVSHSVVNDSQGVYLSSIVFVGAEGATGFVVEAAETYVSGQALSDDLQEQGATDVIVKLTGSEASSSSSAVVLPSSTTATTTATAGKQPSAQVPSPTKDDVGGDGDVSSTSPPGDYGNQGPVTLSPSPLPLDFELAKEESMPEARQGYELVTVLLNVTAPVHGLPSSVVKSIKSLGSKASGTAAKDWALMSVEPETERGPFLADFAVMVKSGRGDAVLAKMTKYVRLRRLDAALASEGLPDVAVGLRARLTKFEGDEAVGGTEASGITSTVGTVAASIAGLILIVVISAGVFCLVPRGPSGPSAEAADGGRRKWWQSRA